MFSNRNWNPFLFAVLLSVVTIGIPSTQAQPSFTQNGKVITVDSTSGASEIALAEHLQNQHAQLYGVYWCVHCYQQIYLFGQVAFTKIDRIECAKGGRNAQPEYCKSEKIVGYPTWKINGKFYEGTRSLTELADISGYQGPRNFKNLEPTTIPEQFTSLGIPTKFGELLPGDPTFRNRPARPDR